MDEEIMDFQSVDNIPWDSIKDLRGTTYFQPPPWFRFALQQAQHGILRAIIHNNLSSLASEPAWKALVLSSWFLWGRPAVNTSESNCAHFVDARLDLFWAEDWSALWAMVRAEYDVAPVQNATRRTRAGEKGRALAADSHRAYTTDPEPPAPAHAFVSNLFLSEGAELFPTTLRKMPRFSEPGPLGMRAEHWYDFGSLAGNSNLFASCCTFSSGSSSPFSATVPQSWTDDTARQTHRRTQISTHDVLSPQVGTQISHGSKEGISCQMCWTFAVWCWTTRWSNHDDQNHPIPCGGCSFSSGLYSAVGSRSSAQKSPQIIAATCGRFHASILQEASDHVPHITDQFIAYTGNTDLAIFLNSRDTFEPNPAVNAFNEASTSKDT